MLAICQGVLSMKPIRKDVVAGAPARFRGASQLDPRVLAADPAVVPDSVVASTLEQMTVRLPEGLLERTKIRAIKEKATLQSLVAAALENYLLAAESGKEKPRGKN